MGNMECESNCEPCRLQGDFSENRGRSSAYAAAVDCGEKTAEAFRSDSLGWGLCMWTYFSRKASLLEWCRSCGCSVADLEGQLSFMVQEMQSDFAGMWKRLQSCTDLREAARLVCVEYEKPAVLNTAQRADAAQRFYDEFHTEEENGGGMLTKVIILLEQILGLLKEMEAAG